MDGKKVIYIAGPIAGVERYWEAFEEAEDELAAMGFTVLTPTRLPWDLDNSRAMPIRLAMIGQADAVFFLKGWRMSVGASVEMTYCKYIGKPHTWNLAELAQLWEG